MGEVPLQGPRGVLGGVGVFLSARYPCISRGTSQVYRELCTPAPLQGYLAHKKHPPSQVSHEQGTPVHRELCTPKPLPRT
jgi:hypothetical protein